ncbi:MAG: flagellar hook protein [Alteromonadaceae bacterium TMED7]|nr:MAG: flagellar hook protein [Alteromonadaceae bacterium TMED7]|tara:strand:- start:10878 stop:12311 length:1434 start_codon:yes stop_codon:yes gene_type:complete
MSISSLGVGSGLALDDLVRQLISAERQPKEARLNAREKAVDAEISALGTIKSKVSDFQDAVDTLRNGSNLNSRETTVINPSEDDDVLTADASNSALRGSYDITVQQLASGSRITTDPGAFSSSTDPLLSSGTGSLTFSVGSDNTFTVEVDDSTTLADLRELINDSAENFGVTANIIETGTNDGPRLVISSDKVGQGNDLVITNDNGNTDLDRLSTTGGTTSIDTTNIQSARNAIAIVDGIEVQSSSNEFTNTIQNVSFTVNEVSPKDSSGDQLATRLTVGFDKEGVEEDIKNFIESYNSLVDEIEKLSSYGATDEDNDGPLAGDSLLRGLQLGVSTIVGEEVQNSAVSSLFELGIELNEDGRLEIGSKDFGLGTGQSRLDDALENNFDDISTLFNNESSGIAVRLYDLVEQYSSSSGLISLRERSARDEKDSVDDAKEALELRMASFEETVRAKYVNLDRTIAQLNQTGSALFAALL